MGAQQLCTGMIRRSKSSLNSLHLSVGSDLSSATSSKQASLASPRSSGLGGIRRSSSSLCLYNMNSSSLSLSHPSVQSDNLSTYATSSSPSAAYHSREVADSRALVQYIVLLAVGLQLPNLLFEIIEILELHIHSFPVLVVLGVFPGMMRKKFRSNCDSSTNLLRAASASFGSALNDIPDYYKNQTEHSNDSSSTLLSPPTVCRLLHNNEHIDDWGHFAYFEESPGSTVCISHSVKSLTSLAPLKETEEED